MKLIFATNNKHKVTEIRAVLKGDLELITLAEAGIFIDIPEPYSTLEENAREKSTTIYKMTGMACFSEDSGLEIAALNGEPGVRSARYAGEGRSDGDNINLVLRLMDAEQNRSARFRTVISLIIDGKETSFEGIAEGEIILTKTGSFGFGYDPIFVPAGSDKTFGEMSLAEKNRYSHRKKATEKLVNFLNQQV